MHHPQASETLDSLRTRRDEILRVAQAHGASNVRIFGSVARGEDDAESDIDVLVNMVAEPRGFAYFGRLEDLRCALSDLLGRRVDVLDSGSLRRMRDRVLGEAIPL